MLKEEDGNIDQGQRNWLWSDCKLVLRRTNPNNPSEESYENLQAEVQLQSDEIEEPFIPIFHFSKQFRFNNKKGFHWKKGTSLPPLIVKLQKSYLELLQEDEQILMIYCELTVAYPRRKDTHFYLQEILTAGEKRKIFSKNGQVEFNGIILKEASLQKSNSKFSFLVTICASSIQQNKIILKTLISTAFYSQAPRIIRTNLRNSYKLTRLVNPRKFLKPICLSENTVKKYSKQTLIQTLKYLNENESKLSFQHPFYLIYHFSHVLKVFYHSEQIDSLEQLFESISTPIGQQNFGNIKNTFLSYELKKTKKIKKTCDSITINQSKKFKFIIHGKIQKGEQLTKKLLLITFQNEILRFINEEIEAERQETLSNSFQQQLENQIWKLNKKFNKLTYFFMKVDLLRKSTLEGCWKDILKQQIFEAYKKHYQFIHSKLKINS